MSDNLFRIHPAIGFARVGNSKEYYLAPETLTGHPGDDKTPTTGGLPIKYNTENTLINASDLRDGEGKLKRQAARFRIYRYQASADETYPMGTEGEEILIDSTVQIEGKTRKVKDIIWSVHMANKKTAWYESDDDTGLLVWRRHQTYPPLRNQHHGTDIEDPKRLKDLIIDPGPRTIKATCKDPVQIDRKTKASCIVDSAVKVEDAVKELDHYPRTFPQDAFQKLYPLGVENIDSLGTLEIENKGRLLVAGGYGRANSFNSEGPEHGFNFAVNNDSWFDDTGDGPVDAVLVFDDGSIQKVQGSAWVVSTDPAYAPQIVSVVSLWDDIYDTWVRKLNLRPELKWDKGKKEFTSDYEPSFEDEVRPILLAPSLQRWVANLNPRGIEAHKRLAEITGNTHPKNTILHGLGFIRKPANPEEVGEYDPGDPNKTDNGRGDHDPSGNDMRMPLSLGDAGRSMLSLTYTQYFYLERWDSGKAKKDKSIKLNLGEHLDKAALLACLGGRFGPGIDMTYIVREPTLYVKDGWRGRTGPFRINHKHLDYTSVDKASAERPPFLTSGWKPPLKDESIKGESIPKSPGLEPGDISKFMAVPWHADYNSCAIHLPSPNPATNNTLYWSWPAQRPVSVHVAKDVKEGDTEPPHQRYSVRGPGTKTIAKTSPKKEDGPAFGPGDPGEVGRYQKSEHNRQAEKQARAKAQKEPHNKAIIGHKENTGGQEKGPGIIQIINNWMKIGTVIQATNIDDKAKYDPNYYLEVQSQLSDEHSDDVSPINTVRPDEKG